MIQTRRGSKKSQDIRKKNQTINNKVQKNLVGNRTIHIRGQIKNPK